MKWVKVPLHLVWFIKFKLYAIDCKIKTFMTFNNRNLIIDSLFKLPYLLQLLLVVQYAFNPHLQSA